MEETMSLQLIVLGAVLATLLLVVAGGFFYFKRKRERRAELDRQLNRVLSNYRKSDPEFCRVLQRVVDYGYGPMLLSKGDARAAMRLLESRCPPESARQRQTSSVLNLSGSASTPTDSRVTAAMVTILRSIYLDRKLVLELQGGIEEEMDIALDFLTESQEIR
jgi:hypothetical protein